MFDEKSGYLELEARKKIYECISKSPGLHLRELQRRTQLATGSLDYHMHFLKKHGLVRVEKRGKFALYYPYDKAYDQGEKDLLSLLRQEKIRHILIFLMQNRDANASAIAEDVGISPSNLSFYLKTLLEKNIIVQKKKGRFRLYSVASKEKIIPCLVTYKASFLDNIVDRFIEAWEE